LQKKNNIGDRKMFTIKKFINLLFFVLITPLSQGTFATEPSEESVSSKQTLPVIIIETTMGSYTLELDPEKAPKTVTNFLTYVDEGFYDNTLFHRVIPSFVIQGGGFEKGMKKKQNHAPVINESDNGLLNTRGAISMARTKDANSATSQFFINVTHNPSLDFQGKQPGYTVFGKVTDGMDVIDKIIAIPTTTEGSYKDMPKEDVVILSAKLKGEGKQAEAAKQETFTAGEHYIVLDKPVATRDSSKIEVVEMFSYGCAHCYEFEPLIKEWGKKQSSDVDFWFFPALWNEPMKIFARAFYAAQQLDVQEKIHLPLFNAVVIEQKKLIEESELADFFAQYGVDKKAFVEAFNSAKVQEQIKLAEERVHHYSPAGVPEIIVNGKYRIDRMRAGGMKEMLAVADYLISKERAATGR
jgi:cyclophilin family peptidyl-prolyl cis-trans isomerase/protein-disulfide isomerase